MTFMRFLVNSRDIFCLCPFSLSCSDLSWVVSLLLDGDGDGGRADEGVVLDGEGGGGARGAAGPEAELLRITS